MKIFNKRWKGLLGLGLFAAAVFTAREVRAVRGSGDCFLIPDTTCTCCIVRCPDGSQCGYILMCR